VLIVDDEAAIRFGIREYLHATGYLVDEAENVAEAEQALKRALPDAVVLDYSLGSDNGLEFLRHVLGIDGDLPVIMLTAHGTIDLAVEAMKAGAEQFLTKPVELAALALILARSLQARRGRKRGLARNKKEQRERIDPFRGTSRALRKLADEARRVLPSDRPIFIHGETGSGKGVLARWIHETGPRSNESFIDLNCAGLSRELLESELFGHERGAFTGAVTAKPGLLEIAHRGTLFLDEIGDMESSVQAKLLKVLEDKRYRRVGDVHDRHVDVRLVTATHHDLEALVAAGKFREDLFYRIRTLPLVVPPLRERREDLAMLARDFATRFAHELGRPTLTISDEGIASLEDYRWPGNVRELRNVVERAVLLADGTSIGLEELRFLSRSRAQSSNEATSTASGTQSRTLADVEREFILQTLQDEGGRVEQAARRLGIPRSSLYYKLKRYGVDSKN
jgi:DNA-binding NtrC family response regulator